MSDAEFKIYTLIDFCKLEEKPQGYLWTELGEGQLEKIHYVRSDMWVVCNPTGSIWDSRSYCCHAGTSVYVGSPEAIKAAEDQLKQRLKDLRARYALR